jgi:hypothetical protein
MYFGRDVLLTGLLVVFTILHHPSLKREVLCPDLPVSLAFLYQRGHRWQPIKEKDALRYYLHLSMLLAVLAVPSPCS